MPWHISKQDNKYAVVNSDTGKTKSVFKTLKDANKYLRALYANYKK